MKKIFMILVCLTLFSAMQVSAGGTSESGEKSGEKSKERKFLQIKTSAIGGTWYACGAAWSKLISENTDFIAVNSASPGLEFETMQKLKEGTVDIGFAGTSMIHYGRKGGTIWKEPIDLVALFATQPGILNVVGLDKPGIDTISDLKGKTISTYPEGNYWGDIAIQLLEVHGVTKENSKIMRVMKDESARMLADGQVDAIIHKYGYGHGVLRQLAASRKIKFFEGEEEPMKIFMKNNPFFETVIFGEEFGVANADQLVSNYAVMTMASFPEDLAYLVTKIWFENKEYLLKTLPSITPYINWEDPTEGITIPFHPGAIRYFKEAGIWNENYVPQVK